MNDCQFCKQPSVSFYAKLSSRVFKSDYSVLLCESCGIGITNPTPVAGLEHYEKSDRNIAPGDIKLVRKLARQALQKIVNKFKGEFHRQPISLIDVGCGYGFLIEAASAAGLKATGIEPSEGMAAYASKMGRSVFTGSVFDFHDWADLDVIVLESVAEHFEDIVALMSFLHDKLNDHTMLVFGQAVYDGIVPITFKQYWYGWSPKEHYWHFSESSFRKLVESCGFQVIKTERKSLVYRAYFGFRWKTFIFSNVLYLFDLLARVLGRGDHVTFYLKK